MEFKLGSRIITILVFCLIIVAGIISVSIWQSYRAVIAGAKSQVESETQILTEHAAQSFNGISILMDGALSRLEKDSTGNPELTPLNVQHFKNLVSAVPQVKHLVAIRRDGSDSFSSIGKSRGVNLADRTYFKEQKANKPHGLFFDEPVIGRATGSNFVPVSHRISGPGNRFDGVLMVVMDQKYFSNFYAEVEKGKEISSALVSSSGKVFAWSGDFLRGRSTEKLPSIQGTPLFDKIRNNSTKGIIVGEEIKPDYVDIISYSKLANAPYFIVSRIDKNVALEKSWKQQMILFLILGIFASITLIWISRSSLVQVRLREKAEASLKETNENLEESIHQRTRELTESESRLKEAQSLAHLGSWSWNIETGEENWSKEQFNIFGMNPAGPAPTYDDFLNAVDPDDKEDVLNAVDQAFNREKDYDIEFRIVRSDGEIRFVRAQAIVNRDEQDSPIEMLGTVLDTTTQKQVEQLYDHVLINLADGAVTINTDGIIEYVNPMAEQIFGYSSDEMIGQNVKILMPEPDSGQHDQYLSNYLETGNSSIIGVGRLVRALRKDGSVIPVDLNISERTEDNKTTFFGTVRDMTERVKAEEALVEAKINAETSDRVKSEFLANMSHEIRTPLNAILGFSSTMMQHVFGELGHEKYEEYVIDINSSGQHLLALINDILDVSAIEAGKLELEEENLECNEVIDSVLRLISSRAEEQKIEISKNLNLQGCQLKADERRFKQILLNLLSNAVKFTPSGKNIEISVSPPTSQGMEIRIADQGCGMTNDEIDIAMTPFGQVGEKKETRVEGTGLGLPLTKALVEAHDGTLSIESEPNVGTIVIIRLPNERIVC
ncbi:MAG: PAS domain S-box protein [Rhodospirillaceae bacterium]|nr:PAS domain S-box protein [Rhodospirillaceae bacterium]MBT5939305.1 PAS domain S-box protein [Rhodospirillaceae bacterium]MBT7265551.1 PAS domain S-box protein [Rhodospirillaceae bacterium]